MINLLLDQVEALAKAWEQDAARRREEYLHDPVAGARSRDAKELAALVAELRKEYRTLNPEQYASLINKSAQTVRRWCRTGQLPCERDAHGDYVIFAGAKRRLARVS